MVLTRPDQPDPQKKDTPRAPLSCSWDFGSISDPPNDLDLEDLVGDARFVNEWKIETAEPTKTKGPVGCGLFFLVMFVWEGW